jgi:hypothetical protein
MSGHTPFRVLSEEVRARPGGAERLEAAGREIEREHNRLRWRVVRTYDRLRARLRRR